MNAKLLRKVAKHILAEPRRFTMESFGRLVSKKHGGPECGTVACIAGWAHLLQHKKQIGTPAVTGIYRVDGIAALDLTNEQAVRLFYLDGADGERGWPTAYYKQYEEAKTNRKKARVAAARIEHFIKTKGRE